MDKAKIEKIEIDLLLNAILQRYGHDLRDYTEQSCRRRILFIMHKSGCKSITEITSKILHDPDFFVSFIQQFLIPVTEFFRNPPFFKSLRKNVLPYLRTYPFIKIWSVGCATGEEPYSLAIMLKEEGLYDRATIFATDYSDQALEKAKEGIYPLEKVKKCISNYQEAMGTHAFSDYIHAKYDSAIIDKSLKQNITFANHNLATDSFFAEMHLILCRNVLIYFNEFLQKRVFKILHESLAYKGFLALGKSESLMFSNIGSEYKAVDKKFKIYQRQSIQETVT